jgi:hypothetical protein
MVDGGAPASSGGCLWSDEASDHSAECAAACLDPNAKETLCGIIEWWPIGEMPTGGPVTVPDTRLDQADSRT